MQVKTHAIILILRYYLVLKVKSVETQCTIFDSKVLSINYDLIFLCHNDRGRVVGFAHKHNPVFYVVRKLSHCIWYQIRKLSLAHLSQSCIIYLRQIDKLSITFSCTEIFGT